MTPGIHSHISKYIPNTQNEVPCNPINPTKEVCTNAYCPHRPALEKERCCTLQLTAANRVLEEGQRYLEIKSKRLESELRICREEVEKLNTIAAQERIRRKTVENELHTLELQLKKKSFDTQYSIITQSTEVECLQEERKLLIEQVLQLQNALNEMVQLNEILQHALRSNDTNYIVPLEKNTNTVMSNNNNNNNNNNNLPLPNVDITTINKDNNKEDREEKEKEKEEVVTVLKSEEDFIHAEDLQSVLSSIPTTTPPSLSPSTSPLGLLVEIEKGASHTLNDEVNNYHKEEEDISNKSTKSNNNSKDSNNIHLNIIQHNNDNNNDNNNGGGSESVVQSMQGAISELEALRGFLSSLETKS